MRLNLEQVHDAVMSTRVKVSKEKAKEGPTWYSETYLIKWLMSVVTSQLCESGFSTPPGLS